MDKKWATRRIGPVVMSRFTTTQTRAVRTWISEEEPSFELQRIIHYLVFVWGPLFLTSKLKNQMEDGSRLLLLEMMLAKKHCSNPEFSVLKDSMDHNGQFGHPENILVSLLSSTQAEERRKAVDIIFDIRERGPQVWKTPTGQRSFKVENKGEHIFC